MKTSIQEEGQRLKKILAHEGIKQIEFAREIGVLRAAVSKYIGGTVPVPASVVKYLNKQYHMSIKWFYTGEAPMKAIEEDKRSLVTDTKELRLEIAMLQEKLEAYVKKTDQMIRDFYEFKNKK